MLEGLSESVGIILRSVTDIEGEHFVKSNRHEIKYWNQISKGLKLVQMRLEARIKEENKL